MRWGSAPLISKWAARWASVFFLPEPAPAMTSSGPMSLVFPNLMPYSAAFPLLWI